MNARIVAICLLGEQVTNFGNKEQVGVMFALDDKDPDGANFEALKRYTVSTHEKAALRKLYHVLNGKMTDEEAANFDPAEMVGQYVRVRMEPWESDSGRSGVGIEDIVPVDGEPDYIEAGWNHGTTLTRRLDSYLAKSLTDGVRAKVLADLKSGGGDYYVFVPDNETANF